MLSNYFVILRRMRSKLIVTQNKLIIFVKILYARKDLKR